MECKIGYYYLWGNFNLKKKKKEIRESFPSSLSFGGSFQDITLAGGRKTVWWEQLKGKVLFAMCSSSARWRREIMGRRKHVDFMASFIHLYRHLLYFFLIMFPKRTERWERKITDHIHTRHVIPSRWEWGSLKTIYFCTSGGSCDFKWNQMSSLNA